MCYFSLLLLQAPLSVPQTSSCVGTGVALARGSCAMEQMIVEMAVMRAHIKTAVSPPKSSLRHKWKPINVWESVWC